MPSKVPGIVCRGTPSRVDDSSLSTAVKAKFDLSEHVVGRYEYLLRFELSANDKPADSRIESLAILTHFQHSPMTRTAYVKFAIRTESSLAIQRLWTRFQWRPDGAKQALAMVRTKFSIRPSPPTPLPALDTAARAAPAKKVASLPPRMTLGATVTLLLASDPAGRKAAKAVMAVPDAYFKLDFAGTVGRYAITAVARRARVKLSDLQKGSR
jgi:hypothetical protein